MEIRRATEHDLDAINAAISAIWPDQAGRSEHILKSITGSDHASLVAVEDGRVVGFVDSFVTAAADGTRRWEVDLLGVLPAAQGKGIGKALIDTAAQAGKRYQATVTRALIQVENIASRRAFQRMGFHTDGIEHLLYLAVPSDNNNSLIPPDGLHIVPVQTFSYQGCWIEGDHTPAALAYTQILAQQHRVVGMLLEVESKAADYARELGFTCIDRYQWWRYPHV